jgi:hypothetical protein
MPKPKMSAFLRTMDASPIGGDEAQRSILARMLADGAPQPAPQYGPPTVQFPIGRDGETETRPAGVGPVPPPPSRMSQYLRGVGRDIASDPMGAALGALDFVGAGAGSHAFGTAARTAANPINRGLVRRELRSVTESGAAKNRAEDVARGAWRDAERTKEVTDLKDWASLPPYTLQPKDPKTGRFQKIPDDVKALREQGRKRMDIEKKAEAKYPDGKLPDFDY